jgi:hypothetical protein
VVKHLPSYLGPNGPYHNCIEELRRHTFLEDLRSYLDELVSDGKAKEIADVASQIERLALQFQNRVFRKYLSGWNEFATVGKAAITDSVGLALPYAGVVTELVSAYFRQQDRRKMRWAGFVADVPVELGVAGRTDGD